HWSTYFPSVALARTDGHSLPYGQSICSQYDGRLAGRDVFDGLFEAGFDEHLRPGCGYAVAKHELHGKILAAFKTRSTPTGADHRDSGKCGVLFEVIADSVHERAFRANHDEADLMVFATRTDPFEVVNRHRHVGSDARRSGVARRNENLVAKAALLYLPGQSVFAASV